MLGRRRLDVDAVVDEQIGGAQALLARVDPEGEVVQPAVCAVGVGDVDQLVGRDREAQPRARLGAVVALDPLVEPVAEELLRELAVRAHVGGEHVDVVEPLDGGAPARRSAAAGCATPGAGAPAAWPSRPRLTPTWRPAPKRRWQLCGTIFPSR